LTRTKDGARGKKQSSTHDVKGSLGVASGTLTDGMETSLETAEGYTRVFDPYWANARALLDYLSENDLLQHDLDSAKLGQFVLAKGYLSVLDLAMLKDAWKLPTIARKVLGSVVSGKTSNMSAAAKAAQKEQKENAELMLEMMQLLPHSVHASLLTSQGRAQMIWCTLREEYLAIRASDITLSYGSTMPGEWSMVGILSASPEFVAPDVNVQDDPTPGVFQSVIGHVSKTLAPIVRVAMGRPAAASAITPLLIFREIT